MSTFTSRIELDVLLDPTLRNVDLADELTARYQGLRTTVTANAALLTRLAGRDPAQVPAQLRGLTAGTPVLVTNFTNAGFNGIVLFAQRADMPGAYLHLQPGDVDPDALAEGQRRRTAR